MASSELNPDLLVHLDKLRGLSRLAITDWHWVAGERSPAKALQNDYSQWPLATPNEKGHLSWAAGETRWLGTTIAVPADLQGYPTLGQSLRISLVWWSIDVQIYVNGQLVQAGDLFDARVRVLLSESVTPGECYTIHIRMVSPGHDRGALMGAIALYESELPEPGTIADEIAVASHYGLPQAEQILDQLDWTQIPKNIPAFQQQLLTIRQTLAQSFDKTAAKIQFLGHAHLDLAWLWPVAETWEVAERTFKSVLALQDEYPELTFCHTSPVLYQWFEENRPELFAQIQAMVATGRWEIVGGMWVEPDLNLISGESIARQIIYGQRYIREKFGKVSKISWLPDTFGFCQQLPQLLQLGQIDYFVTQKFRWNDTNPFPHQLFWWESLDGSRVLSYMSSPIGEGIEPVKVAAEGQQWQQDTGDTDSLWLCGVGDHGGGPTRDMLEIYRRWQDSPLCPQIDFTTAEDYLSTRATANLPTWKDELYLEFHRGCYTTHADQKQFNRNAEAYLYQAELWTTIAALLNNQCQPQPEIAAAWKLTLFQQFHDILPGSAIPSVYAEANLAWEEVQTRTQDLTSQALSAITDRLALPPAPHPQALPIVVFNSLNWSRSGVVRWPVGPGRVVDDRGNSVAIEMVNSDLIALVPEIPSIGYRLFWLIPGEHPPALPIPDHWTLRNDWVEIQIDPQTGDIARFWDQKAQQEIFSAPGNQLQAFTDSGQYWDAWNIDPHYAQHPLPAAELLSIDWIHYGQIEQRLQVVRQIGQSRFSQVYVLTAASPCLDIETQVDWQERHVLIKALFPLAWTAPMVTGEVACGAIERPTTPTDPLEKAKWEVPIHRWIDSTDPQTHSGLAILNNSKYGCSYQADRLELTLLRGATWPDPEADLGQHEFTYSLYPHAGSWQQSQVVRQGYALNSPLLSVTALPQQTGLLPTTQSFLSLDSDHLILMALYPALNDPQTLVLRCYEAHGQTANCQLTGSLGLGLEAAIDLLETPQTDPKLSTVRPWQIKSWRLRCPHPSPLPSLGEGV
jgi:alpha-mannosidase